MKRFFSIVAAVGTLLVVGCGDDSSTSEGEGPTVGENTGVRTTALSRPQYTRRANEICGDRRAEAESKVLEYMEQNGVSEQTLAAGAHPEEIATTILIPAYQRQIDEIRSLGVPRRGEARIVSILDAMQRAVDEGREDPARFTMLVIQSNPFTEALMQAKAYGLTLCAEA